jgi:hypothetical protein
MKTDEKCHLKAQATSTAATSMSDYENLSN